MPHTLEWHDHADPPKRGNFEHDEDMVNPHILARCIETVLQQAGVNYEPPIRVIYTSVDYHAISEPPYGRPFCSVLQLPSSQTNDSSV